MKKYLVILFFIFSLQGIYAQNDLPAIEGEEIRLPLSDAKTLKYVGFLYAKKGSVTGYALKDVVVDIFKSNLDSSIEVRDMSTIKLYSLDSQLKSQVKAFWDQYPHSQGIILSSELSINPNSRRMMGEGNVNIYSLGFDLVGKNYVIDIEDKSIEIKNGVKTVIRQDFMPMMNVKKQ